MHRSRLCAIVIDVNDLHEGARFWASALGTTVSSTEPPYAWLKGGAGDLMIGVQLVPEPKTAKSRVHLDFESDDIEAEVTRLEQLGARRQQFSDHWWVMEDPFGNEFCVVARDPAEMVDSAATWEAYADRHRLSECRWPQISIRRASASPARVRLSPRPPASA